MCERIISEKLIYVNCVYYIMSQTTADLCGLIVDENHFNVIPLMKGLYIDISQNNEDECVVIFDDEDKMHDAVTIATSFEQAKIEISDVERMLANLSTFQKGGGLVNRWLKKTGRTLY